MDEYYCHKRLEMASLITKKKAKVLDVGCGVGLFGKHLNEEKSCEVWGFEPNENAFKAAVLNLHKVFNSYFNRNFLDSVRFFDYIIFNDVLEHMEDPWKILMECKDVLKEDGMIVSSIPNFLYFNNISRVLFERDFHYKESGILDKTHLRFFTKKSMIRMFNECGYQVISIEGIHPLISKKMKLINLLTFNKLAEMQYLQFAVCAKPV